MAVGSGISEKSVFLDAENPASVSSRHLDWKANNVINVKQNNLKGHHRKRIVQCRRPSISARSKLLIATRVRSSRRKHPLCSRRLSVHCHILVSTLCFLSCSTTKSRGSRIRSAFARSKRDTIDLPDRRSAWSSPRSTTTTTTTNQPPTDHRCESWAVYRVPTTVDRVHSPNSYCVAVRTCVSEDR